MYVTYLTDQCDHAVVVWFVCGGAQVILGCRNMELCENVCASIVKETSSCNVHCHRLDLASLSSICEFANKINSSK